MQRYMLERGEIIIPGNGTETLRYAVQDWIVTAQQAIQERGAFLVALSGGSTPKQLFQQLASPENKHLVDWSKVSLFWSDERAVGPEDLESNYRMALVEGKLNTLPIPKEQIFRLRGEGDLVENALSYEKIMRKKSPLDLIMLGLGEDGHTASLFPHTKALFEKERLVMANYIPQKESWRLTFTYPLIHQARKVCLYVLGQGKSSILEKVLKGPNQAEELPSQNIGRKAHWIVDQAAAHDLLAHIS